MSETTGIALQLLGLIIAPLITTLASLILAQTVARIKDGRLRGLAIEAVMAAQQHIPATSDRYAYAAGEIARRFPSLKGDEAEIKRLIEAAVFSLKQVPLTEDEPHQS